MKMRGKVAETSNVVLPTPLLCSVFFAECHYAERRYAERRYADCRYPECRGTVKRFTTFAPTAIYKHDMNFSAQT